MPAHMQQDVLIEYPASAGGVLASAVYALYYLPRNYKFVITGAEGAVDHKAIDSMADEWMKGRVSFDGSAGASDAVAPFSFVLRGEDAPLGESVAREIRLRDADTPEALASAILKAARA